MQSPLLIEQSLLGLLFSDLLYLLLESKQNKPTLAMKRKSIKLIFILASLSSAILFSASLLG
ncbi:MAG: hypothetical protein ACJAZM_002980 [Cyclobacteriaceae bacterium]